MTELDEDDISRALMQVYRQNKQNQQKANFKSFMIKPKAKIKSANRFTRVLIPINLLRGVVGQFRLIRGPSGNILIFLLCVLSIQTVKNRP